jgi:SsrA-binding protein
MIIATNKKTHFDYFVIESYQAGLNLSGQMTKAIRNNRVNIAGKFIVAQGGQLEILGLGNEKVTENVVLLLNKKEKNEIAGRLTEKGISCVILNLKTVGRWIKAEIGLVKGKKNFDKRETIKKRDLDREEQKGMN